MNAQATTQEVTDLYDPWGHADRLGIQIYSGRLPGLMVGGTDGESIWLDERIFTYEATNTLAHEIVHWELGHGSKQPAWVERSVNALAISRLYPEWLLAEAPISGRCGLHLDDWLYERADRHLSFSQIGDLAVLDQGSDWDDFLKCSWKSQGECAHGRRPNNKTHDRSWLDLVERALP